MEKSLVVLGKNLEAALDKGAQLLHCPKERVAYEILTEPKPRRNGHPSIPCKLRVTPVSQAVEELEDAGPASAVTEKLPWAEWDLAVMPSRVFLLSLQNLMSLVPSMPLFPSPETLPKEFPEEPCEMVGDLSSGMTLDHPAHVRLYGQVRKAARIRAAGNIHIHGDVETAFLDAGGDIVITGGLLGTARSRCGNITAKFAQGARLDAPQGDVTVHESAMHSHIRAGRNAFVGDLLLGGSCTAEILAEVRIAGSETGVPTQISAGPNMRLLAEIDAIREQAAALIPQLREQDAICRALMPSEEAGRPLSVPDRVCLWRALIAKTRINDSLAQMARQKGHLLGMINKDRTARVCVTDRAYPKVKITVDALTMDLQNLTQYATFSKDYDAGEIRITPYR